MVPIKTVTMGHILVDRSKFLIGLCRTGMLLQFCHGYTGCPIKNDSTLRGYHFGAIQYFFKQFSLNEHFTSVL
jgi:hypothetical protein